MHGCLTERQPQHFQLPHAIDQQQLSFHLAMTMTTVIMIGIIYLKYILPDTIIVKHAANKYIPEHAKDWREYKW